MIQDATSGEAGADELQEQAREVLQDGLSLSSEEAQALERDFKLSK